MSRVNYFVKAQFCIGLLHGLLLLQGKLWQSKVNNYLQFLIMAVFCSQIFLINEFFSQLPNVSWPFMLENFFNPVIGFCFLICMFFGLLQLGYGVGVAAIMKSLISET